MKSIQNELILYGVDASEVEEVLFLPVDTGSVDVLEKFLRKKSSVNIQDNKMLSFKLIADYTRTYQALLYEYSYDFCNIKHRNLKIINGNEKIESFWNLTNFTEKTNLETVEFDDLFKPYLASFDIDEKYYKSIFKYLRTIADKILKNDNKNKNVYLFSYDGNFIFIYNIGTITNFRFRELIGNCIFTTAPVKASLTSTINYID